MSYEDELFAWLIMAYADEERDTVVNAMSEAVFATGVTEAPVILTAHCFHIGAMIATMPLEDGARESVCEAVKQFIHLQSLRASDALEGESS